MFLYASDCSSASYHIDISVEAGLSENRNAKLKNSFLVKRIAFKADFILEPVNHMIKRH